jgi:beta-barrel assembly-enhancing protease
MSKVRLVFLLLIILGGIAVAYFLFKNKSQAPIGLSFSPAFQLLGKSTSSLNIALTRIMPINEMDEKVYGEAIAESYLSMADIKDTNYIYLNMLMKDISVFSKKRFNYHVFVISTSIPNAFALPGGVICVTNGLMNTLKSEAQLISVLSHEMGHIERGHCFDAIKYELTFRKIKAQTIGQFADFAFNLFLRHSYSKTQENAADEYGYDLVLLTKYDPMAFSDAFRELQKLEGNKLRKSENIVSDYFQTHPPLALRIQKFSQMAALWWTENYDLDKRYIGIENLKVRIPFSKHSFSQEWINHNIHN